MYVKDGVTYASGDEYADMLCARGEAEMYAQSDAIAGHELALAQAEAMIERQADEIARLRSDNEKLIRVLKAAVELVCAPAWAGVSDEDCELERVLRECGYVEVPAEHVPSRTEQFAEERRAEWHAEMRADAFGDKY